MFLAFDARESITMKASFVTVRQLSFGLIRLVHMSHIQDVPSVYFPGDHPRNGVLSNPALDDVFIKSSWQSKVPWPR